MGVRRGGGWVIKDVSCRKNARSRKYGALKVGGKLGSAMFNRGPPCVMTPHCPGIRLYLFPPSSEALWFPGEGYRVLCPIANGFSPPAIGLLAFFKRGENPGF